MILLKSKFIVIIKNINNKFLLKKEETDITWMPLSGEVDSLLGESPVESARKQIKKLLGLKIALTDLYLFSILYFFSNKNMTKNYYLFMFLLSKKILSIPYKKNLLFLYKIKFFDKKRLKNILISSFDIICIWKNYITYYNNFIFIKYSRDTNGLYEIRDYNKIRF